MTDQQDHSGHVMVALYPSAEVAGRYAMTGGLPAEDLHVTMAYLGRTEDVDRDALLAAVKSLPPRQPFMATVAGHGRFTGGEQDVLVLLMDSPELERLRSDLLSTLAGQGIEVPSEHGFTAHMTLTYMDEQALMPLLRVPADMVEFGAVWVKYGDEKVPFLFEGDGASETIRSYARTAYAQGWAASGGPLTDGVHAGCVAVMDMASRWCDRPEVLEVALHLGHLEGVWATVFERRMKLFAEQTRIMKRLWRELTKDVDVAGAVTILRQQVGLSEAIDRDWLRRVKAAARAVAQRILQWLPGTTAWQTIRDAMRNLVVASRAEGYADAVGVAASEQHLLGYDFDLAFQHAYDALENLGDTWAQSDAWLERMLGGVADEFGRTLGDLAAQGAEYSQMVAAGLDVLQDTVVDEGVVGFMVDWAASAGLSRGALDLYRSENVEQVSWLTAGDGRVCPVCEDYESESPYLISDFPDMPAHPRCRCVAYAEFTLSSDYGGYFS